MALIGKFNRSIHPSSAAPYLLQCHSVFPQLVIAPHLYVTGVDPYHFSRHSFL